MPDSRAGHRSAQWCDGAQAQADLEELRVLGTSGPEHACAPPYGVDALGEGGVDLKQLFAFDSLGLGELGFTSA